MALTPITGEMQAQPLNDNFSFLNQRITDALSSYNVKDYGAIGDGITDDSVAIQSCIDVAEASGRCTVIFPAADYLINTVLTIHHGGNDVGTIFYGPGAKLIAGTVGMTMLDIVKTSADNYQYMGTTHIKELFFEGNSKASIGININELGGFYKSTTDNISIHNCTVGIKISDSRLWNIKNTDIYSPDISGSIGIQFVSIKDAFCGDCWVGKCQIVTHATTGKAIYGLTTKVSTGSTLNGIHINNCVLYGNGIYISSSDALSTFRDWWISDCAIEVRDITNVAINLTGVAATPGSGAVFISNIWANGHNTGILATNLDALTINGGKINSTNYQAVNLDACRESSITSLKCYDCNKTNNGGGVLMLTNVGYRNKIIGNSIYNVGTNTLCIIYIHASQVKPIVTNNTTDAGTCVTNNVAGVEGTDFIVAGNLS